MCPTRPYWRIWVWVVQMQERNKDKCPKGSNMAFSHHFRVTHTLGNDFWFNSCPIPADPGTSKPQPPIPEGSSGACKERSLLGSYCFERSEEGAPFPVFQGQLGYGFPKQRGFVSLLSAGVGRTNFWVSNWFLVFSILTSWRHWVANMLVPGRTLLEHLDPGWKQPACSLRRQCIGSAGTSLRSITLSFLWSDA